MSDEDQRTDSFLSPAANAPHDVKNGPENASLEWAPGKLTKDIVYSGSMADMLVEPLKKFNFFEATRIVVVYNFTADDQHVGVGLLSSTTDATTVSVFKRPGNFMVYSNALTRGNQETKELIIPNTFARQLTPPPSRAKALAVAISISKGVDFALYVFGNHYGIIFYQFEPKF